MSVTGTDIRVGPAPTATRAFVVAAILATGLAAGIAIGRGTVSTTTTTRSATIETTIPTTWLGDTPVVRTQVMRAMNALSTTPRWLDTSSQGRVVMQHMNELTTPQETARAATTVHVIRYLTELAPRGER